MYQYYLNEARAAEYQQQCRREAAIERSVRASRKAQHEDTASGTPYGLPFFVAVWLRNLGHLMAQNRIVTPR